MNPSTETEHHFFPTLRAKKAHHLITGSKNPTPSFDTTMPSSSSPSHSSANIANMDHDHLFSILHLLPLESIVSFSMTCKKLRSLASYDPLWESLCRRDFGDGLVGALVASLSAEQRRGLSWKRIYEQISCLGSLSCLRISSKDGIFPRPRASHSLNFVSDCLVLFGGGSEGGRHLDDTWVAYIGSGFTRIVGWQKINSGIPSGRFGHSCTVVDDTLILFGGINDNGVRLNDTWIGQVIHQGSMEIKISWRPLDVGPIAPPPRGAHAACCAGEKRIVVNGGIGLYGLRLNDMWLLDLSEDLTSGRWRQIVNVRPSPPARSGHTLTWIGGNHMVLFGGRSLGYEVLSDAWLFNIGGDHPQWIELKYESCNMQGEIPLPRVGHSATLTLGGRILIYGGEDSHRRRKDDFWILDISTVSRFQTMSLRRPSDKMWKKLNIEGHCPNCRSFHGACADKSGRYVFLFGGMVDGVVHTAEPYGLRFDGDLYLLELLPRF